MAAIPQVRAMTLDELVTRFQINEDDGAEYHLQVRQNVSVNNYLLAIRCQRLRSNCQRCVWVSRRLPRQNCGIELGNL